MRSRKNLKYFLFIVCALFIGMNTTPLRAETDPMAALKDVTVRVMDTLKKNRTEYQSNPARLYTLVDELILPYADFEEMARWVAGRNAWGKASTQTQQAFVAGLKNLVVRTYARSLLNYTDQTIEFLPMRQSSEGKSRVVVSSIIRDGGRGSLRLDYRLVRHDAQWRVYDIVIEGVSLMQGYHAQFENDINQNGLDGAVQKLNQRGAAKS